MTGKLRGFTLVELIVVIATIGILATITLVGLTRYQGDTRDARRASSVSVIAEALEKYYDQNGEYPACNDVTAGGSTLTANTLKGISTTAIVAPQATPGTTNSIECQTLTIGGTDLFEYDGDGSPACNGTIACLEFVIKYKDEGSGTIKSLASRRNTSIAPTGAPTLSSTATNFTDVGLSWTSIQNASSYTVQQSTSPSFTSPTIFTVNAPATTTSISGLTLGSSYYFRVLANANSSQGPWSNSLPLTTKTLNAPVPTATPNSNTQITVSWAAVTNAATYKLDWSTSSTFASGVTSITGIATTSQAVTGLSVGTTYYFRVASVNGVNVGPWSTTVSATPVVPAPASIAAITNSSTQITASWSTVAVATSYTLDYSTSSTFASGVTSITGIVPTNKAVTGLTPGKKYYFRVFALVGATSSVASPTANATTTVVTPGAPSLSIAQGGTRAYSGGWWVAWDSGDTMAGSWTFIYATAGLSCAGGTTPMYQMSGQWKSSSITYSWTNWGAFATVNQGYMVGLLSSSDKARMTVVGYCAGTDGNSANSPVVSACLDGTNTVIVCDGTY